jgi:DNA-binding beta-propeller fold protein YncE
VLVIDGNPLSSTFHTVISAINLPTSNTPVDMAFNAATNTLYVAAPGDPPYQGKDDVFAINFNATPPITTTLTGFLGPVGVAVDPVLSSLYVTSAIGFVSVLDAALNPPGVLTTIDVGTGPLATRVNATTGAVYVVNLLDPASSVPSTVPPGPFGNYGSISVIDGSANPPILVKTVFGSFISGPHGLAVDPAADRLYITSNFVPGQLLPAPSGTVSAIDTNSNMPTLDNFTVGMAAAGIA